MDASRVFVSCVFAYIYVYVCVLTEEGVFDAAKMRLVSSLTYLMSI